MSTWRVNNSASIGGEVCSQWQANHAYGLGARCVCTYNQTGAKRGYVYEVTSAGTSHASTEPNWPTTPGNTVVDNGATWTCRDPAGGDWNNASAYLWYLTSSGRMAAGDVVLVDDGHTETGPQNSAMTIQGSTTLTNPYRIFCVDKTDDSLSEGASIRPHTSSNGLVLAGAVYSVGIQWKQTSASDITVADSSNGAMWIVEQNGTTPVIYRETGGAFKIGNGSGVNGVEVIGDIRFEHLNCTIAFAEQGFFKWRKGKLVSGTGITALLDPATGTYVFGHIRLRDVDLTDIGQGATATAVFKMTAAQPIDVMLERCKLPTDAGFAIKSGNWQKARQGKVIMHHCSGANAAYDFHEDSPEGVSSDETTIVRTGGASDGTTGISIKMVSTAAVADGILGMESPPIHGWTASTTAKTFTIEGIRDSATNLQNDEIWLELEYPADGASGLGAVASTRMAPLGTAADVTASAETWTTTGMANPNTFKLSVTVTPGKAGPITARIVLAKASTTIFVDPKITES